MDNASELRPSFLYKTLDAMSNFPAKHPIASISALVLGVVIADGLDASFVSKKLPTKIAPVIEAPGVFCRYTGYDSQGDGTLDYVCRTYPIGIGEYAVCSVSSGSDAFNKLQEKYSLTR